MNFTLDLFPFVLPGLDSTQGFTGFSNNITVIRIYNNNSTIILKEQIY